MQGEPTPTQTGPAVDAVSDPVDYNPAVAAASASAAVIADLSSGPSKRDVVELQTVEKRGDCAKQPDGYGPKPTTDTVEAFEAFQTFHVSLRVPPSQLLPTFSRTLRTPHLHPKATASPSRISAHQ